MTIFFIKKIRQEEPNKVNPGYGQRQSKNPSANWLKGLYQK